MSNVSIMKVRTSYGALLQEIHTRLAEVASQHTREELEQYFFTDALSGFAIKDVVSFHEAQLQANRIQADFDQFPDWQNVGTEVYLLKLDIDGLARHLMCPTAVRDIQSARQAAEERAARPARKPVVQYKKPRRVVIPTAVAA
jgi:hypothetical protein